IGDEGAGFYEFLISLSKKLPYQKTTELLSNTAIESRFNEELILRFLAVKNYRTSFKGSVSDWLDNYMEAILLVNAGFNRDEEEQRFDEVFDVLAQKLVQNAFVKYRGGKPMGGVAPAYFEAVTMAAHANLDSLAMKSPEDA